MKVQYKKTLLFAVLVSMGYLVFCQYRLGYYVEPQEWLTGAYKMPVGHRCFASTETCKKWFSE